MEELGVEPDKNQPLFICHANCPDSVAYVKELLEERFAYFQRALGDTYLVMVIL